MSIFYKISIVTLIIVIILGYQKYCNKKDSKDIVTYNAKGEKMLKISFYNYKTDEYIECDFRTLEQVLELYRQLPQLDNSFLTIKLSQTQTLQFYWIDTDCIAEITNNGYECIYDQRYVTMEEAQDIIQTAYNGNIMEYSGFVKVPIKTKTLKDVLTEHP